MSKCNGCRCQDVGCGTEHCDDLHKQNDEKIERAGKVIKDTEVCDLPKLISKGVENIWCVFKNIIHNICCLSNRMDCVEEKEYRIGTGIECIDPRITTLNLLINYINSGRILSNQQLQELLDAWEREVAEVREHNAQEQNRYIAEYNEYQQDLATSETQTRTEKYATEPFSEYLHIVASGGTIDSSNIAPMDISSDQVVYDQTHDLWNLTGYNFIKSEVIRALKTEVNKAYKVPRGQTLELNVTPPDGWYYKTSRITKAKFKLTSLSNEAHTYFSFRTEGILSLSHIPCGENKEATSKAKLEIECYGENGRKIDINENAFLGLNSLNSFNENEGYEFMEARRIITINGSSVIARNNRAFSATGNGAGSPYGDWDGTNNPNYYKGSAIGEVGNNSSKNIELIIGGYRIAWEWYFLDTNIQTMVVPHLPEPINRLPIPTKPAGEIQDLLDFSDVSCLDKLDDPDSCINAHPERNPKHHL